LCKRYCASRGQGIPELLILEDGANILSQNVGNQLPTYAAQHPSRTKTMPSSFTDIP
jgi:hypothetical protein